MLNVLNLSCTKHKEAHDDKKEHVNILFDCGNFLADDD